MIVKMIILGLLVVIPNEFKVEIWNFIASKLKLTTEIKDEKLNKLQKSIDNFVKIDPDMVREIPSKTTQMLIDQMDETNVISWLESKGYKIESK